MSLSICNEDLDHIFFVKPSKIVIYGEAAVGKTNLLLNILKCSVNRLKLSEVIYFISTEGSTFIEKLRKLRLDNEKMFISIAIDQLHLVHMLIDIVRMLDKYSPYCVIIDSINSHYRVESISTEGIVLFNEILTLLDMLNTSNVYVVVSAQVRNIDGKQEIPGYEYLQLWADVVAYVSRNHPFYRILRIHKPSIDKMFYFDITLDGIRWIRI